MYAIPQGIEPQRLVQLAPQDVLGRAFDASGVPFSDKLDSLTLEQVHRLADAVGVFMTMGPNWNRPEPA